MSASPGASQAPEAYAVKSGDTLSKIAKEKLGAATAYIEIFNANRAKRSAQRRLRRPFGR